MSAPHPAYNLRRACLLVVLSFMIMMASAILMMVMGGGSHQPYTFPNENGFTDAIVWFELAESPQEIFLILGPADIEAGQTLRKNLDQINYFDYGFMACYSLYHLPVFMLLILLNRGAGRNIFGSNLYFYIGLFMIAAMWMGDAIENYYLLQLTNYTSANDIPVGDILRLQIWTRVKWVALFGAMLHIGISYASYLGLNWRSLLAVLYTTGAVLGLISLASSQTRFLLELAGALLFLGWIVVFGHAIIRLVRKQDA